MSHPLGINGRNAVIAGRNPRRAIADARDKVATKSHLERAGIPVPPTITTVATRYDALHFDGAGLPAQWVVKPARGSRGRGVLLATGTHGVGWRTPGGVIDQRALRRHVVAVVSGEFAGTDDDAALFEPLLRPHDDLAALSVGGLADVRIVCDGQTPLGAMARLPTVSSGGRGNLHQGGIAVALDLATGTMLRAVQSHSEVTHHSDTGASIIGRRIHDWDTIVSIACRCSAATGLGYLGVDIVVDAELGPVVLEVNSHPGLEIQNVTGRPLRPGR